MDGWMDGWCFLHRNELTNWLGFVRCVLSSREERWERGSHLGLGLGMGVGVISSSLLRHPPSGPPPSLPIAKGQSLFIPFCSPLPIATASIAKFNMCTICVVSAWIYEAVSDVLFSWRSSSHTITIPQHMGLFAIWHQLLQTLFVLKDGVPGTLVLIHVISRSVLDKACFSCLKQA